ncbi:putative RNA-directed DNA polymerase like protein [Argiope bruennichi]|uniref:Putative RNA-directed DNA polymerase like protein n=1 Tax=Argiope bruennichi TaxID=94029 RepID=A0A8T0FI79_ARGBR|nr:putative RNA-directed DNA polymerase like protein [Argiope bruennichi]
MATYLRGRLFTVRVGSNLSSERIIEAGVVQGSKIGPILFNIYVNDIPSPRNCQTQLCLFADDTAIMSTGESINVMKHLNDYLDELGKWLIRWKVKVNTDKCQAVYFTRKKNTPDPPKLFRRKINWSNCTKYLGVTLDKRLTYKEHIDNIRNKVKACRSKLYPMMGPTSPGAPFKYPSRRRRRLDIAKAFDKVWIPGLFYKLIAYKFPRTIVELIISYLSNRYFTVLVKQHDSSKRQLKAGVPQGGILAPVIFLLYLNDIPQQKDIMISLYADDTAILSQGRKPAEAIVPLQNYLTSRKNG